MPCSEHFTQVNARVSVTHTALSKKWETKLTTAKTTCKLRHANIDFSGFFFFRFFSSFKLAVSKVVQFQSMEKILIIYS